VKPNHILTEPQGEGFLNTCKFPLLSGGFGSGKSEVMHLRAVTDFVSYKGIDIAIYAPSYDLLTLNNIPRIEELLIQAGVQYELNKGTMKIVAPGYGVIIFRSMANPERIIAYEVARSYIDEIDTLSKSKAEVAWNKIIARNRQVYLTHDIPGVLDSEQVLLNEEQCEILGLTLGEAKMLMNKVSAYTTPEGFNFTYDRWVVNPTPDYEYVKMPTWSNPHLPPDYVQSIRDSYPKQLAEAYLAGEWVNLNNGSVYGNFDRKDNNCETEANETEHLIVGMDFNVERACSVIFVKRKDQLQAVDEVFNAFDTNDMIAILKDRYNNPITVYPDKTGRARKSVNATESDIILLKNAGFKVKELGVNPPIKERVVACNNGFEKEHLAVNVSRCPNLTTMLEQQVWDGNGMPNKDGKEDINDAFGYPVHALYKVKRNVSWAYNPRKRHSIGTGGY